MLKVRHTLLDKKHLPILSFQLLFVSIQRRAAENQPFSGKILPLFFKGVLGGAFKKIVYFRQDVLLSPARQTKPENISQTADGTGTGLDDALILSN